MTAFTEVVAASREIAATALCALASVFAVAGAFGVLRFPDAYTRLQASSLTGTTAVFSVLLASLAVAPSPAVAARVVVILIFFLVSNPTTTHIIGRYAWKSGLDPWTGPLPRRRRYGAGRNAESPGGGDRAQGNLPGPGGDGGAA